MEIKVELESCWFKNKYFSLSVRSKTDLAHDSKIIVKKGQKLKLKYIAKSDDDLHNIKNLIICKNISCEINTDYNMVEDNGYEVKCFQASYIKTL